MTDIAVFDPVPLFRFGLLTALGLGGAELSTPQELSEWLATRQGVLVYTVSGSSGEGLPPSVVHSPGIDTVAVLETFTITRAADLLRAGAANVVDRAATAAEFRRVVADTRGGQVTVSAEVLSAAISAPRRPQSHLEISDEELSWLRELADGKGVSALAERATFSERMMYRKLSELYRRLGVSNRTQALMVARGEGWL